ncbi:MAG: DHA2 family efflux MFS transporter permease subunit [Acidimicrobiaceae bacterium]|nr:DHA2 family efflux MFS transporter permease subunit [Acidimicrobiaceae bacterium]
MVQVPRQAWLTLAVVSASVFMVAMELTIIALALTEIRDAFAGTTTAALSWVISAYSIVVAALLLGSGWLADRYGRRRIFRLGLTVFALGSIVAGASTSITMLIAARGLQAVGGSMQYPAGLALLLSAFPQQRRQTAIGIWGSMGALAAAMGPSAGALLIELFNWRAVFYVNVPVAAAALALSARALQRDQGDESRGRVDMIGAPLASFGVGAIILGVVQGQEWGWASGNSFAVFALGVVMIAGFVVRSTRHAAPLFDLELMRIRSFSLGNLGSLFFSVGFFALLIPLPAFMQDVWGWSVVETGLAYAVGPTVSFLVAPQAGRLADRVGNAPLLTVGSLCGMGGTLWYLLALTTQTALGPLLGGSVLLGIAAGTGFSQLVGAALHAVPADRYAMAAAGRTTFFQLSVAFAIALAFTLIGEPTGGAATLDAYRTTWLLSVCAFACNFVLFAAVYPGRSVLRFGRLRRAPADS